MAKKDLGLGMMVAVPEFGMAVTGCDSGNSDPAQLIRGIIQGGFDLRVEISSAAT